MDMYPSACVKPVESTRHPNSPSAKFSDSHVWLITRIDFIFRFHASLSQPETNLQSPKLSGDGLMLLDAADTLIFEGLIKLIHRTDNMAQADQENDHGLNQIIPQLFLIIAHNWSVFIDEAEEHLEQIVSFLHHKAIRAIPNAKCEIEPGYHRTEDDTWA